MISWRVINISVSNTHSIISDKIAESMFAKNDRAFWREIKNYSNSKLKLPNAVGDAQGSDNISVMCQEHYSHIFNMVSEINCKSLHADLCKEDSLFDNDMIVTSMGVDRWGMGGRVPPPTFQLGGDHIGNVPPTFWLKKWKISCVLFFF